MHVVLAASEYTIIIGTVKSSPYPQSLVSKPENKLYFSKTTEWLSSQHNMAASQFGTFCLQCCTQWQEGGRGVLPKLYIHSLWSTHRHKSAVLYKLTCRCLFCTHQTHKQTHVWAAMYDTTSATFASSSCIVLYPGVRRWIDVTVSHVQGMFVWWLRVNNAEAFIPVGSSLGLSHDGLKQSYIHRPSG